MIWPGSTSVRVLEGYSPITTPAIEWIELANGNWAGSDRGASEDVYEAEVTWRGIESEWEAFEDVLAANREAISITCGAGEEIFGADVDYSSPLSVVVQDYGREEKASFALYTRRLKLRLLSPTFQAVSPNVGTLRPRSHRYFASSEFDISRFYSLDGTLTNHDRATDPGVFEAEFRVWDTDMAALRRYLLVTARANIVTMPTIPGISRPFGRRAGTGPFNSRVIRWRELGRRSLHDWSIRIAWAREF